MADEVSMIADDQIRILRGLLEVMRPSERLDVFGRIMEGYCRNCGGPSRSEGRSCQCDNDE